MSKESDSFVNSLKAAFPYMSQQAVALYQAKLEKWRLTKAQWMAALDVLIQIETDGNPPQLSAVYGVLKQQQESAKVRNPLGWASFTSHGKQYSIRIKHDGRQWVISDLVYVDNHGNETHLQPHAGESVVEHIPVDATDFLISPDDPPKPEPEELPSRLEVKEFMAEINANLSKLKEVPF